MTKFFKKCKEHHFAHFFEQNRSFRIFCSYQFLLFWLSIIVPDLTKNIVHIPRDTGFRCTSIIYGTFPAKARGQKVCISVILSDV